MSRARHRLGTSGLLAATLGLVLWLLAMPAQLRAEAEIGGVWEPTSLTGPVVSVISGASGGVVAMTTDGAVWSVDGEAWSAMDLLPGLRVQAIDPVDPSILYAWGPEGLYRRVGEGAWQSIYSVTPLSSGSSRVKLAVSPADHQLLYLAVMTGSGGSGGGYRLLRSSDGGATWEEIGRGGPGNLCDWQFLILQPHPTDVNRVFRSSGCLASRDDLYGVRLHESNDRGATWTDNFYEKPLFPVQIVGSGAGDATRFYLLTVTESVDGPNTRTIMFRGDGNGVTWTQTGRWCCSRSDPPGVTVDPSQPDHVFLFPAGGGGVRGSFDGGETWGIVGERGLTDVHGLAIHADGSHLYAATEHGLFRLALRQEMRTIDAP